MAGMARRWDARTMHGEIAPGSSWKFIATPQMSGQVDVLGVGHEIRMECRDRWTIGNVQTATRDQVVVLTNGGDLLTFTLPQTEYERPAINTPMRSQDWVLREVSKK